MNISKASVAAGAGESTADTAKILWDVEARIGELQRLAGDVITPLGVAPLPEGAAVFPQPADAEWDWVVLRLVDDPLYQRGELAMPNAVRQQLTRLDNAGVAFDDLLIAHEVLKGQLAARALKPDEVSKAILTTPQPPTRGRRAFSAVLNGLKLAGTAALTAPLALAGSFADPVLIGVITSTGSLKPGTPAAYFLVARW
jgi:hypothetical protein